MMDACPNFGLFVVEVLSLNMGEFYLVEDTFWGLEGGDDDCGFALSAVVCRIGRDGLVVSG